MKFKIGDKVQGVQSGAIYEILFVGEGVNLLQVKGAWMLDGDYLWMPSDAFEPIITDPTYVPIF